MDSDNDSIFLRNLLGLRNDTREPREYNPITMNNSWPTLWRLTFLIMFTFIGSIVNGFFVSAFFIERSLKKAGNVYLSCVGLADMFIATGVAPVAAVVLMSGEGDTPFVCHGLQMLAQTSIHWYNLLFLMVALESNYRLCTVPNTYQKFITFPVGLISLMTLLVSISVSVFGVYFNMDYDYCYREFHGNYKFRMATFVVLELVPFLISVTLLVYTSRALKRRARREVHYRRSLNYDQDSSFTIINIAAYMFYVVAWIPYLIVVNVYPDTSDMNYYATVWIGLSRSVITSLLYCCFNRYFRRAFSNLFNYCCCKNNITPPYNHRHRRTVDLNIATGDTTE